MGSTPTRATEDWVVLHAAAYKPVVRKQAWWATRGSIPSRPTGMKTKSTRNSFRKLMAKIRTQRGFRFVKELGGAIRHNSVSAGAKWLVEQRQVKGRVLDYGCGHGFDADHFGWDAFDPYYRPVEMTGPYDTILCNHVLNMLTLGSREQVVQRIQNLLAPHGNAYLIVPRNIPVTGKVGLRKRIQNYVVMTLPSLYANHKFEIYQLKKDANFEDVTQEIEQRLDSR